MSVIWSEEEVTLLESVRSTLSTREIKELFKVLGHSRSVESIRKKAKKMGIRFKDFGLPATFDLTDEEKKALSSVLCHRENRTLDVEPTMPLTPAVKGEKTKQQRLFQVDMFNELHKIRQSIPRWGSVATKKATTPDKQSLVVLLSDWHLGQIVTDTEHNIQTYNTNIALDRIQSIPERVFASLTPDQLNSIDECIIILAGDMVSGEGIFPHHEMFIHDHAAEQVLQTVKTTWKVIQGFRGVFPLVRIVTTKGNHGRTGASPEANWDNIIYQQLELLVDLDGKNDITIKNRYGNFASIDIRGWRGHIRHWGPAQTETAAGSNKTASWMNMHEWDFFCYGHWHHWGAFSHLARPVFRNGSLIGEDDYAESLAKRDGPTQLVFGVTEEQIGTFINVIKFG